MTANARVALGMDSQVLLFFPCPSCGHRVYGNYCSNCGEKTTAVSRLDCIKVNPARAASILETALEDIAEASYRQSMKEGVPEEEMVARLKQCFDVPEKVKPRERR